MLVEVTNSGILWSEPRDLSLNSLAVSGTELTDAGLQDLTGLTELSDLDLYATKVTDEGVKNLQQALPNCNISDRHER